MESVIDIRGLGLTFERDGRRTDVLQGLDLAIPRGAFIAIVEQGREPHPATP